MLAKWSENEREVETIDGDKRTRKGKNNDQKGKIGIKVIPTRHIYHRHRETLVIQR